jgi:hypothetical protein
MNMMDNDEMARLIKCLAIILGTIGFSMIMLAFILGYTLQ